MTSIVAYRADDVHRMIAIAKSAKGALSLSARPPTQLIGPFKLYMVPITPTLS